MGQISGLSTQALLDLAAHIAMLHLSYYLGYSILEFNLTECSGKMAYSLSMSHRHLLGEDIGEEQDLFYWEGILYYKRSKIPYMVQLGDIYIKHLNHGQTRQ